MLRGLESWGNFASGIFNPASSQRRLGRSRQLALHCARMGVL
jgi:hypothetical protein